jgi:hypothetical protein
MSHLFSAFLNAKMFVTAGLKQDFANPPVIAIKPTLKQVSFRCYTFTLAYILTRYWDRGSTVVKVLRYKSEGRWFDPRWCHGIFIDINPSDCTMALGSTQSLTEMSTGSISWG